MDNYRNLNLLDISRGLYQGVKAVNGFGRNPNIDANSTPQDIWAGGGLYTGFPTGAAEEMEIFSDDLNDTLLGSGARTVKISDLLDASGARMPDVEVDLNGTTPVSLGAELYYRAAKVLVLSAGSTEANEGVITLRHITTTVNVFAKIPIGVNRTLVAVATVPLGESLYVNRVNISLSRSNGLAGSANCTIKGREHGSVFHPLASPEMSNSSPFLYNGNYIKVTERVDLKITCESVSDNNTFISTEFEGLSIVE